MRQWARHALGRACAGGALAAAASLAVALAAPTAARAGTPPPGAPGCPMFPADNVWNTDISALPVNAHSASWMASMASASTDLHPDFGPSDDPANPYGMPSTVVAPGHPTVGVAFDYADESDPGPYPFGPDTPIEGGQNASGDRHALMVDPATCTLYELYNATYNAGGSTAGSGAIWNLRSNALRPATWTSADAAGLPILPGILRYDELSSGSVTHAIRMTATTTDTSFIWPARHEAGARSDPTLPSMGARFRLSAHYDISGYSPQAQVVLRAMQHYGLILADNGSNWYFGGSADLAWPPALVDELKRIPARAFEAVDESSLMVSPDSGQARQGALPAAVAPPAPPPPAHVAPPAPSTTVTNPIVATTTTAPTTTTTLPGAHDVSRLGVRHLADTASTRRLGPGWLMGALAVLGLLAAATGSTWAVGAGHRRRAALAPTGSAQPGSAQPGGDFPGPP